MDVDEMLVRVRAGDVVDAGSWIYAWLRSEVDRPVIYVGGTGLPPAARTWLHLNSPDPAVGWIATHYPDHATEPLDVLALPLDRALPRPAVRAAVIHRLDAHGLLSDRYVGPRPDPPAPDADVTAAAERMLTAILRHRPQPTR